MQICNKIWPKNAPGVNTSDFADRANLANLKSEVNKLDIGKLKTTPVDLSNLSDVVKTEFIKITVYDEYIKKVNLNSDYSY